MGSVKNTLTIPYSPEVLWALQKGPEEFETEARLLLALKLYETGKLSTGLAAQLAGVPRLTFLFLLGQHGLSPFGEDPEELEGDLADARRAGRSE
jgi:predicted HTH domain antitoxin